VGALELFSLAGRRAVVTGASRGIGLAIARGLAEAGASVVGLARSAGPATPGVSFRRCDVAERGEVERAFAALDGLEVLVNAAGISLPPGTAPDAAADAFARIVEVDLHGAFACCQAARALLARAGGSVVNVTSINSVRGFPGNPGYVAAKGGLAALTRALAVDWGSAGIRVNALAPGYTRTAMTEASHADPARRAHRAAHTALGRWAEPEDMVGAAIFLASDASRYVTGQEIFVDGGWTAKGLAGD
jgi:NAD(P)-dependent dehydrogenase (short-subunit alcohol dehydrogenase family)